MRITLWPYARAIENRIDSLIGGQSVVRWNDMPGRKKTEVIEVLDKAISKLIKEIKK